METLLTQPPAVERRLILVRCGGDVTLASVNPAYSMKQRDEIERDIAALMHSTNERGFARRFVEYGVSLSSPERAIAARAVLSCPLPNVIHQAIRDERSDDGRTGEASPIP